MSDYPRPCKWLRRLMGNSIPRNIVVVEVASKPLKGDGSDKTVVDVFDFGVASYCKVTDHGQERIQTLTFYDPQQFWLWAIDRVKAKESLWIVARKLSRVITLLGVWESIERGVFSLFPDKYAPGKAGLEDDGIDNGPQPLFVDKDPPTILLLHTKGLTVHCVDVENYGKCSMGEIHDSVKQVKLPKPLIGDTQDYREVWLTDQVQVVRCYYCNLMLEWHRSKLGPWRHTSSGLAMAAYRSKYLPKGVLIHNCSEALEIERKALAGGYTFCFRVGHFNDAESPCTIPPKHDKPWEIVPFNGPIHVYDVNSLYPFIMKIMCVPIHYAFYRDNPTKAMIESELSRFVCCADVTIRGSDYPYPVMTKKDRCWPLGDYTTTLCGDELVHAWESGHVHVVHRIACYEHAPIFGQWVKDIYAKRIECRMARLPIRERLYKLLLNGLCGRWGQKNAGWEWIKFHGWRPQWGLFAAPVGDAGEYRTCRAIAGSVQTKQLETETLDSCPIIEAAINSAARIHMFNLRRKLPDRSIVYQGVDALHVTDDAFPAILDHVERFPGELGMLKHVGTYRYGQYRGPMDYTLEEISTVAGMSLPPGTRTGQRISLTEADTARLILTRDPAGQVRSRTVSRMWGHYHPAGTVDSDGWVTSPQLGDLPPKPVGDENAKNKRD